MYEWFWNFTLWSEKRLNNQLKFRVINYHLDGWLAHRSSYPSKLNYVNQICDKVWLFYPLRLITQTKHPLVHWKKKAWGLRDTASVMHWVWLSTSCCPNTCPQSIHDSYKEQETAETIVIHNRTNILDSRWQEIKTNVQISRNQTQKGKEKVDSGNLESRALPEVIRKLGFLKVVAAVLALKPNHLFLTSTACSVCVYGSCRLVLFCNKRSYTSRTRQAFKLGFLRIGEY